MQRNRKAQQDGGFLTGMFLINHPHVSDGERAKSHWGHVSAGLLHGFPLTAGAVLWEACTRDSTSLSVSVQLGGAFLGVQVHGVITENLCVPPPLTQAGVRGVGLCESLHLGLTVLLEHTFVSTRFCWSTDLCLREPKTDRIQSDPGRCGSRCGKICLMSQSSPLSSSCVRAGDDGGLRRFSRLRAVS